MCRWKKCNKDLLSVWTCKSFLTSNTMSSQYFSTRALLPTSTYKLDVFIDENSCFMTTDPSVTQCFLCPYKVCDMITIYGMPFQHHLKCLNVDNMESSLVNLKEEVHCSLCNDTLIEPKILQCFHTFCKLCIKRHADLIDQANVFKCPKCSSETSLQDLSSVDNLKPSLFHSRILKVLEFVESEKVCSVSGSHSTASWHCVDCNRSLCDECYNSHSIFTQNHKVVCLTDPKNEDIEFLLSKDSNCVHHNDKTQEFFCNDCDQVICVECLKQDHDRHSTSSLVKYTSTKKAMLSEQLEHVKRREKEIQSQVEIIEETTSRLKSSCEKAKQDVRESLQKIIDVLEGKSVELLRQIDEIIENAEKRKAKGQCVLDQKRSFIEYMNKLIEKGLPSELLEKKDIESYNKLIRLDKEYVNSNSKVSFVCNDELMKQVESGLGSILQTKQTDSSMSIVEADSEIEAQKKAKLIVSTKTSTKELNNDPSDVVDVKITPEDDVKVEEKYVRSSDCKIEIEFMAKVPGQLTAEVKVNGNPVLNSPMVMNVELKKMRILNEFKMKGVGILKGLSRIAVNKENSKIAVADGPSNCVHVFNTNGDLLMTHNSRTFGEDVSPMDLVFVNETDLLILESKGSSKRICKVRTTTNTLIETLTLVGKDSGTRIYPREIHIDDNGNIIVTNGSFLSRNNFVEVFTKEGNYQYQFGLSEQDNFDPVSTVTRRGLFYVSDYNNHVIHVFKKKGNVPTRISTIGGQGSADGQLSTPWGLAIDNDHNLLVCDRDNKRIQKFTLDGRFVGKTCDEIKNPGYIAVLKNGQLLVTSGTTVFYVG